MLASAVESGVDAVMRRPLESSILTSCVGEVLRRHAGVEFVYKVCTVCTHSGIFLSELDEDFIPFERVLFYTRDETNLFLMF